MRAGRQAGPTTEETEEVRRLRREVTALREEREILLNSGGRSGIAGAEVGE